MVVMARVSMPGMAFSLLTLAITTGCGIVSYYGWDPLAAVGYVEREAASAEPSDVPISRGHLQKQDVPADSAASGHRHGGANLLSACLHIGADWLASIVNIVVASMILTEHTGDTEERTDAVGALICSGIVIAAAIGLLIVFGYEQICMESR